MRLLEYIMNSIKQFFLMLFFGDLEQEQESSPKKEDNNNEVKKIIDSQSIEAGDAPDMSQFQGIPESIARANYHELVLRVKQYGNWSSALERILHPDLIAEPNSDAKGAFVEDKYEQWLIEMARFFAKRQDQEICGVMSDIFDGKEVSRMKVKRIHDRVYKDYLEYKNQLDNFDGGIKRLSIDSTEKYRFVELLPDGDEKSVQEGSKTFIWLRRNGEEVKIDEDTKNEMVDWYKFLEEFDPNQPQEKKIFQIKGITDGSATDVITKKLDDAKTFIWLRRNGDEVKIDEDTKNEMVDWYEFLEEFDPNQPQEKKIFQIKGITDGSATDVITKKLDDAKDTNSLSESSASTSKKKDDGTQDKGPDAGTGTAEGTGEGTAEASAENPQADTSNAIKADEETSMSQDPTTAPSEAGHSSASPETFIWYRRDGTEVEVTKKMKDEMVDLFWEYEKTYPHTAPEDKVFQIKGYTDVENQIKNGPETFTWVRRNGEEILINKDLVDKMLGWRKAIDPATPPVDRPFQIKGITPETPIETWIFRSRGVPFVRDNVADAGYAGQFFRSEVLPKTTSDTIKSMVELSDFSLQKFLLHFQEFFVLEEAVVGSFMFYFLIGFLLFLIGLYGLMFLRTNLISLLLSVELMLLGLSLCFVVTYLQYPYEIALAPLIGATVEPFGLIVAFLFLALAAAESAIGLALIVLVFRQFQNLNISNFCFLRG